MAKRREDVNYRESRFSDPEVPEWFSTADTFGVRRIIGDYLSDHFLYAFDTAHAIVALPLAALKDEAKSLLTFPGLGLSSSDATMLRRLFRDKSGPIHHFSFI